MLYSPPTGELDIALEKKDNGHYVLKIRRLEVIMSEEQVAKLFDVLYEYDRGKRLETLHDAMEGGWK